MNKDMNTVINNYKFYLDNKEMNLYDIAEKIFGNWYSSSAMEFMTAMIVSANNGGGKAEWISNNRVIRSWGLKPRFLGKKRTIDECYKLFKSLKENRIENN